MTLSFLETHDFTESLSDYFPSDEEYRIFQNFLSNNPEAGRVMPGCGGIRKVRWADPRRGKGKRGGIRIIYLLVPDIQLAYLLTLYDKEEASDLTLEERKLMSELAETFRQEARAKVKREASPNHKVRGN